MLVHALEMSQVQKWAPAELAAVLCEYASYGRVPAAHLALNVRAQSLTDRLWSPYDSNFHEQCQPLVASVAAASFEVAAILSVN